MNARHVSEATMRVRDAIYDGLRVREGEVLTEAVCRERAANVCHYVIEALVQLAEESKPPPVRFPEADRAARAVEGQDVIALEETIEDHARRVIR